MAKNPFVQRGTIRDTRYFYGRRSELNEMFNYLRAEQPQCCAIVGDGKIGKSSFLHYISDPTVRQAEGLYSEKHIFVHFDFQRDPKISRSDFWRRILKDISRQINDPRLSQEVTSVCDLRAFSKTTIEELVETLEDEEFKLFFLFDEFEVIEKNPDLFDPDFLEHLRYLANHYDLAYVVASEVDLYQLIPERFGSPFPNVFGFIRLGLLSEDETRDLIEQAKNPVEPSLRDEESFIVRMAGRHPYLTQIVCYYLFDLKAKKEALAKGDYETVRIKSLAAVQPFFEGDLWPSFTDRERLLLISIAWRQEADPRVYKAELNRLKTKQYIRQQDGRWVIFCDLLRSLIRGQSQGPVGGPTPSPPKKRKPRLELEYDDFEILIDRARPGEGYPIRVFRSGAGEADDMSPIDPTSESMQTYLKEILKRRTNRQFLKEFGKLLLEELLTGRVRRRFDSACGQTIGRERGLRVRLRIDPPELACLPWEFLYMSEGNRWLAASSSITLSRYVEAPQPARDLAVPKVQLPLNILCVLSNPSDLSDHDLPRLDLETEFGNMKKELEDLLDRGLVTLEPLTKATTRAIYEKLLRGGKEYHILHFSGHGYFADEEAELAFRVPLEKERGYLLLQNGDGLCCPVHEEDLADLLRDTGVRLVILNACQTAASSPSQRFVGLATTIVRSGPPAVIAMQYSLPDEVAQRFAGEFYAWLAGGLPVDVCVAEARKAIAVDPKFGREERDWATPVLYMRSPDGVIFDIKSV